MPYNISKVLIAELPKDQRGEPSRIGQQLLDKSGGICSLYDGDLNLAADVLEVDHDEAEAVPSVADGAVPNQKVQEVFENVAPTLSCAIFGDSDQQHSKYWK